MRDKLLRLFPAFNQRNYKLYFSGQIVSLIGTWLHIVGEGWLVYQLTHSAFWVGVVTALGTAPMFLFSLFAGAISDRFSNKTILYCTMTGSFILAILLGVLTLIGHIQLWQVGIISFGIGLMSTFDMPARQSFLTEMVEKQYLSSAIAMNAAMFNGARALGPAIAGLLLALIGPGGVFIINGLSFLAGIIAVYFIQRIKYLPLNKNPLWKSIKEGVRYSYEHREIRYLLFLTAMTAVFGWSYGTIFPVIVEQYFHKGADYLGYLHASVGLGAVIGAVVVSALSHDSLKKLFIFGGTVTVALGIFVFTLMDSFWLSLLVLVVVGFALVIEFSTINSTLQHSVDESVIGRVMSIFTFMSAGFLPFGSFQVGAVSQWLSPYWALRVNAGILIVVGCTIYYLYSRLNSEEKYSKRMQYS